jgi:hypothetical protein
MRWGRKFTAVGAALGCLALVLPGFASADGPANDNFAERLGLESTLPVEVSASNIDATKEEPWENVGPFSAGHSVWFVWEAPASEWVTVSACDSEIPAVLAIFTGAALDNLTRVTNGNASEGPSCPYSMREYTFKATNGSSYDIAVDGNPLYMPPAPPPVTEGNVALRIESTPPPVNDDFANATTLAGPIDEEPGGNRTYIVHSFGYNWGADKQVGEGDHDGDPGGASVWYDWVAPESGTALISSCCAGAPSLLGVYRGNTVDDLTEVGAGDGFLEIPVTAGNTYRIAVDGKQDGVGSAAAGSFNLMLSMSLAPALKPDGSAPALIVPAPPAIAPKTTISSKKIRSKARSATFAFRSDSPGSTFRCRVDGHRPAPCRSPKKYSGLSAGRHTFRVYAVDAAGNADATPATARFTASADR